MTSNKILFPILFFAFATEAMSQQYDGLDVVIDTLEDLEVKAYYKESQSLAYKGRLVEGKRDGKWTYFNTRRRRKSTENYKEGLLEGEVPLFDNDGIIFSSSQFAKGIKNGSHDRTGYRQYLTRFQYRARRHK